VEKTRSLANLLRKLKKFKESLDVEIVKLAEELADNEVEEYFIKQQEKVILKKVNERLCVSILPLTKKDNITARNIYAKRGYPLDI